MINASNCQQKSLQDVLTNVSLNLSKYGGQSKSEAHTCRWCLKEKKIEKVFFLKKVKDRDTVTPGQTSDIWRSVQGGDKRKFHGGWQPPAMIHDSGVELCHQSVPPSSRSGEQRPLLVEVIIVQITCVKVSNPSRRRLTSKLGSARSRACTCRPFDVSPGHQTA